MKKVLLALAIICVGLQAQSYQYYFTSNKGDISELFPDEAFPSTYIKEIGEDGSVLVKVSSIDKASTKELQNRLKAIKEELRPISESALEKYGFDKNTKWEESESDKGLKREKEAIEKELKRRKNK